MSEPAWSDIQRPGAVASYVLPLMAGILKYTGEHLMTIADFVAGTGFLIAGGRGLGITARHVAMELLAAAPIPDPWTRIADVIELRVPLAGFIGVGEFRGSGIGAVEEHPTEDVALFRLVETSDHYSPYTISVGKHEASAEYSLWGYPDEVRHDFFTEGYRPLNVPLVYSGGHIRRRCDGEIPITRIPGRSFYELSIPAGTCCSGAPVSIRRDPWTAIWRLCRRTPKRDKLLCGRNRDPCGSYRGTVATTGRRKHGPVRAVPFTALPGGVRLRDPSRASLARAAADRQWAKSVQRQAQTGRITRHRPDSRNALTCTYWTHANVRSHCPVPLHTCGRRFDTVRAHHCGRRNATA
jgi:hypothetical protein